MSVQTVREYAILNKDGEVIHRSSTHRWSHTMTLKEAAEKFYPGSRVVTRTRTSFDDIVSEWENLHE